MCSDFQKPVRNSISSEIHQPLIKAESFWKRTFELKMLSLCRCTKHFDQSRLVRQAVPLEQRVASSIASWQIPQAQPAQSKNEAKFCKPEPAYEKLYQFNHRSGRKFE
jgi:hypothetical protein